MKNFFWMMLFSCFFLCNSMHAHLTQEDVALEYSLLLLTQDMAGKQRIAIIPGWLLLQEKIVTLTGNDIKFDDGSLFNDIEKDWQRLTAISQQSGCYTIKAINKRNDPYKYIFDLSFLCDTKDKDDQEHKYAIILDPTLQLMDMLLIATNLIVEKSQPTKEKEILALHIFDSYQFDERDEQEMQAILKKQKEPSLLVQYARKVGVLILIHYMAGKNYCIKQWHTCKEYMAKFKKFMKKHTEYFLKSYSF